MTSFCAMKASTNFDNMFTRSASGVDLQAGKAAVARDRATSVSLGDASLTVLYGIPFTGDMIV